MTAPAPDGAAGPGQRRPTAQLTPNLSGRRGLHQWVVPGDPLIRPSIHDVIQPP